MTVLGQRDDFDGVPVTVMGLGLFGGGAGVARHFAARGARVTVTDLRDARDLAPALALLSDLDLRYVLGEHRREDFARAALVVANPAVPPDSPYLAAARDAGVPITSELALFLARTRATLAMVSGTHGKSSTASALAQLLSAAGVPARVGGNIGGSLLDPGQDPTPRTGHGEPCRVVEVSSYQLAALDPDPRGRARVAVCALTNVTADHLERHGTPRAYAAAKARLFELLSPGGRAILPVDLHRRAPFAGLRRRGFDVVPHAARAVRGARLRVDAGRFRLDDEDLGATRDLSLPGAFQGANVLVALAAARALGAGAAALRSALGTLEPLPHRVEELGTHAGVRVIDNGVSTTPESTVAALIEIEGPCTLLCGGRAKRDLPLGPLVQAADGGATRVVTFGAAARLLQGAFAVAGIEVHARDTLAQAVSAAFGPARSATLLFSPACTSFDAYPNFRERALAFRAMLPPRDDAHSAIPESDAPGSRGSGDAASIPRP